MRKPPVEVTKPRPADQRAGDELVMLISGERGVSIVSVPRVARVTIGRAPDCGVIVDEESVSRCHAALDTRGPIMLVDLGSRNGSIVDGRALERDRPVELALGTPFSIGSVTAYLHTGAGLRPSAAPRPRANPDEFVVRDPAMQRIYALLDVVGPSPLSVLILGETGVGKEVFAEALHRSSSRATERFLKLNCAALPESILEAELFGYEKGAFTGAAQAKAGLFESAHLGTVMLDEVGDMPLSIQTKLLRVLESGEVLRLGSLTPTRVDVRFVSATHADLRERVARGQFRADLFFRLDGISVTLPPLRERLADIEALARRFAALVAERMQRPTPELDREVIARLERHPWPGNVRELRNVVERAVVLAGPAGRVQVSHLGLPDGDAPVDPGTRPSGNLKAELERVERARVMAALEEAAGNQTRAAKLLGISRHALLDRLDAYGIPRPRKPRA